MSLELWLRLAVFLCALALLLVAERCLPLRDAAPGRWSRWRDNFALLLTGTLLLRLLAPLTVVGSAFWAQEVGYGVFNQGGVRLAFAFPLSLIALDLALYWQHRWMHRLGLLWRLHRVHHSDRMLDVSTGVRFHPGEILISAVFKALVVLALGAPPAAVLAFEIVLSTCSLFTHANLRLPAALDTLLRRLVVTPAMHWIHHGMAAAEHDRNFGFCLSCWDRLFGTYLHAASQPVAQLPLGLAGFERSATGLGRLLRQPLLETGR